MWQKGEYETVQKTAGPGIVAQAECEPEHGRADQGRRRFPLLVKDVAGLVPGAGRPCLPFGVRVRFPNAGIIEFVCNLSLPQK